MKIYGLIGYPIKHSLSAVMHNAAFSRLNIDAEYRLFEVKPEELTDFFRDIDKKGISGLNVTVPYKEKALDFVSLDDKSVHLRRVKAINTIVKKKGAWKGFNTDIPGFARHLKEQFDPLNKKTAVLGAGGAARAVCYVLAGAGAREIAIFDIDRAKAEDVSAMIKSLFPYFQIVAVDSVEKLGIENKDLLVNATPLGLKEGDTAPVSKGLLHKKLFVYDLIYNPAKTKLLQAAEKAGAKTSNGLGMLLYQGMLSFELWTGERAPEEVMRRALEKELKDA